MTAEVLPSGTLQASSYIASDIGESTRREDLCCVSRKGRMPTKAVPKKLAIPLPAGILISDIQCPKNTADWIYGENGNFELWYTERFGWCIPTLHIRNPGRHMSWCTCQDLRHHHCR